MDRKVIAGICITVGLAFIAVPFYCHFKGNGETKQLLKELETTMEKTEDEMNEGRSKEWTTTKEEKDSLSEEEGEILKKGEVIGIFEIDSIGIRYPIVEGTGTSELHAGIGHMSETATIGDDGNCVLAGHNGNRYGEFFTNLDKVQIGETVTLINKDGTKLNYELVWTKIIEPNDLSILTTRGKNELTLFTCAENGTKRYVCRCYKMSSTYVQIFILTFAILLYL